jgi:hypothetical protein
MTETRFEWEGARGNYYDRSTQIVRRLRDTFGHAQLGLSKNLQRLESRARAAARRFPSLGDSKR